MADYRYTGQANLEVMQDAKNYNKYLYNLVDREARRIGRKNIKILDFGAGIGTYADIFRQRGVIVDCVEIDPNGVKVLKDKGYKVYKSVTDIKGEYDIVYSFNVLEHVGDDAVLLNDMKRVVSDDGVIVVYVPAFDAIATNLDLLVEHLRRYKTSDMLYLGVRCKLSISRLQYCDPIGCILAYIYKIIGGSGNLNPKTIWLFDRLLFPLSRALEILSRKLFGKNVVAVYRKH